MKFIIVTKSYDENVGGAIVLHKLCHLINEQGGEAYIHPFITDYDCSLRGVYRKLKSKLGVLFRRFGKNDSFNTPIIKSLKQLNQDEYCVVYPEIVYGNPLNAKNVIRWFLHHPGFHAGAVQYNTGELYYSYGVFGRGFKLYGSCTSNLKLDVTHLFTEYYNLDDITNERHGTAYCLRKGIGRNIIHDLSDSVLIDGLSHAEIAKIFKRAKYFISYDLYTAYCWFAILCGCIPIVIPEPSLSKYDWYPDKESRLGIAYGFDDIPNAILQADRARNNLIAKENSLSTLVIDFINESKSFFNT